MPSFIYMFILVWGLQHSFAQEKIENFAKIKLDLKELQGSRWALEQKDNITVYHAFDIVDIDKVDVNGMSLRVEFHMRQRWEAQGLELPQGLFLDNDPPGTFISAEENVLKSVWSPDSFIPNGRETKIHSVATGQSVVNIFPNKTIVFKARMHSVLGCQFTFEWYPLDVQTCDLVVESYMYTSKVVKYEWEPTNAPVTASKKDITLYQYDFITPVKLGLGTHKRWGGKFEYPYVRIQFKFERKLGNNIIQVFTPTILVVILSWFSFWLGLDVVPGRISLLITCILTLVTMHSGFKGTIPPVHYIKMIDIWMVGCMAFVFGAICECIIVKFLSWRAQQRQKAKEEKDKYLKDISSERRLQMQSLPPPDLHHGINAIPNSVPPPEYFQYQQHHLVQGCRSLDESYKQPWQRAQQSMGPAVSDVHFQNHGMPGPYHTMMRMPDVGLYEPRAPRIPTRPIWVKIDLVARIMFPLLFCIFNAAYWPILFIGASKQHPDLESK